MKYRIMIITMYIGMYVFVYLCVADFCMYRMIAFVNIYLVC